MLLTLVALALLGLLAGGVVNALADDLPRRRAPRLPHYPDGTPRPFVAWLGLTAFLSRRRASPAGARLPWRHPLTELGTAALFVVARLATVDDPALTPLQFAFWLLYLAIFALVVVIDVEHKLILIVVMVPSALLALLDAALTPVTGYGPALGDALLGGLAGFGLSALLYAGGVLFVRVSGRMRGHSVDEVAFGQGDVMLFTLSGLILGPLPLLFAAYLTVLAGALGALVWLALRGLRQRGYRLFTALPYGPYIVFGTTMMLLFGEEVARFMFRR